LGKGGLLDVIIGELIGVKRTKKWKDPGQSWGKKLNRHPWKLADASEWFQTNTSPVQCDAREKKGEKDKRGKRKATLGCFLIAQ